jgi:hypothetical protein
VVARDTSPPTSEDFSQAAFSFNGAGCAGNSASLIKQVEGFLLDLRQLRGFVGKGVGTKMLDVLIEDVKNGLAEAKRKIIQ